ncbi:D-aspartate oxidase [Kwoniella mangroviensis CBS 10435]|uniref:D-aspartate oxidase n=1 Tax=Kwoniella mangroviensis CBS 10435 TaxID=1331196 RepID=A0A1B9INN0_9TREE|nr:D-aspartate oxidase [Kwoniella mangroviensis CBS 8507]OCF57185.1 D-aspartate oxidase [Kwoniella mangroviensis CBS 10435]OCF70481.1 D-aspartate oxidase [Kwoniella mangroviensis CBS 8507]OCF76257.1 D-aspartate oxidase [Kwoniella mangroviensis CBS 8886]
MPDAKPIVVIGAGVIGLTTAVRLIESPLYATSKHPIHILANHLPNDPLDPYYASTIAGAHHLSFADDHDTRQRMYDTRTFQVMYDEWKKEGEKTGLMLLKQTEYYVGTDSHLKVYEDHPDFTILDKSTYPTSIDHSISFTSLTMTPFVYLNRLLKRLEGKIQIHRYHLPSLSHLKHPSCTALIGSTSPLAVFVCTGIGALTLGGVEDTDVYPTRGQVLKLRAPWMRSGWTRQVGSLNGGEGGERTYIIPRYNGEVIIGGTREQNDWYPYPREETTEDVLKRAQEICPDLVPPYTKGREDHDESPLKEIVEGVLVGFRPSREGGIRVDIGDDLYLGNDKVKVVYNYGHGGAGWQSCWGTAEDAVEQLMKSL